MIMPQLFPLSIHAVPHWPLQNVNSNLAVWLRPRPGSQFFQSDILITAFEAFSLGPQQPLASPTLYPTPRSPLDYISSLAMWCQALIFPLLPRGSFALLVRSRHSYCTSFFLVVSLTILLSFQVNSSEKPLFIPQAPLSNMVLNFSPLDSKSCFLLYFFHTTCQNLFFSLFIRLFVVCASY